MNAYASNGICIVSGKSVVPLNEKRPLSAISVDSIAIALPKLDTAFRSKIIEIMKELNAKRKEPIRQR